MLESLGEYIIRYFIPIVLSIFLMLILFVEKNKNSKRDIITCLHIIAVFLICSISDHIELIYRELPDYHIQRVIFSVIQYVFKPTIAIFVIDFIHCKFKPFERALLFLPSVINLLIYTSAFFTHLVFWYDENNGFHRGVLGYSFLITSIINMILILVCFILKFRLNRGRFNYREITITVTLLVGILMASILEIAEVVPQATSNSIIVASCIIYYMTISLQDEKLDSLDEKKEITQKTNDSKNVFINTISHDIRTPMNAIIGFSDLAKKNLESDPVKTKEYLDKVSDASEDLLYLINEVMDISKAETGKITLDNNNVSIAEILKDAKDTVAIDAERKNITIDFQTSSITHDHIISDKSKLTKILVTLLSNAIKFSDNGKKVICSVTEKEGQGDSSLYVLQVIDNGWGISEDFMPSLFLPFEREGYVRNSGIPGSGLGLAILKSIVDAMKGTIDVKSEQGKGSEFTVSITMKHGNGSVVIIDKEKEEEYRKLFTNKRVLVVDDNELNREITISILNEVNMNADSADNGADALDMVEKNDMYDLILMDVQMPVIDGYQATIGIRVMKSGKSKTKIIGLSVNSLDEDKKEAKLKGMDGYVVKPVKADELYQAMYEVLKSEEPSEE